MGALLNLVLLLTVFIAMVCFSVAVDVKTTSSSTDDKIVNFEDLDFNSIMNECNETFRIELDLLEELANDTGIVRKFLDATLIFLSYEASLLDSSDFSGYLASLNESGSFPDETDKTPKCYIQCYFSSIGVMDEEGEFSLAAAKRLYSMGRTAPEMVVVSDIVDRCTQGRNETCFCERAYQFARCTMENIIEKLD